MRSNVKLEQEAQEHIKARRTEFLSELADRMENVEVFISDKLWESEEKEKALETYTEVFLWARYCSEKYGVK